MRLAALTLLALAATATAATAQTRAPSGSFEIKDGRGAITMTAKGVLVGRMDSGSLMIVDLSSTDQWSPRVNGIPRGHRVWLRGKNVSFYIPGGRYRIVADGVGISVSARGTGVVSVEGHPDAVGDTGLYTVGDTPALPLPLDLTKIDFGPADAPTSSSGSGKIQP